MDPSDIFGAAAASHIPVIVQILDGISEHKYEFMLPERFAVIAKDDWLEGQRLYWLEILYRAHFAASTSLIRTARWIDGMLAFSNEPNFTAFNATYRGCLATFSAHTASESPQSLRA